MRTCHFTSNKRQKRAFYLTIVRSVFEHGSIIWSPQASTYLTKFENIHKRAIKWINGESFVSYNDLEFFEKQEDLQILLIRLEFIHNSIMLFYKIVNDLVDISLPEYITVTQPETLRYTRETAAIIGEQDTTTYSRVTYIYVRSRAKYFKFCTTTSKVNTLRKPLMQQKYYFIHEM